MVNRQARNKLAEEIRHFVARLMDHFAFDDRAFTNQTKDAGIIHIRYAMWQSYDDFSRHKLKGTWSLSVQDRDAIVRCVLFLKSDYEYRRPKTQQRYQTLLTLLTCGLASGFFEKRWKASGSWGVWPFLTSEDFQAAILKPVYLKQW